jgi:glycosyltransferase involved in cell wall biosynthesis
MKEKIHRVSIGLPVYNEITHLQNCVDSLLQQTYPNIEICISDNKSTDGTYELATRIATDHPNIRIQQQERNLGALANFNAVLDMADGEFFMWLGADDRIDATYIEKMVAELDAHPQAVAAHSATIQVDGSGAEIGNSRYLGRFDPNTATLLRQALNALSPFKSVRGQKLNLYVYGLHRRDFLSRVIQVLDNPLAYGDRVLPALAALSGGMRYVDEHLYHKHIHQVSFKTRNSKDPALKVRQENTRIGKLVGWFFRCPTIPLWRRWYGLVIAAPFVLDRLQHSLKSIGIPPLIATKFKF